MMTHVVCDVGDSVLKLCAQCRPTLVLVDVTSSHCIVGEILVLWWIYTDT